MDIKKIGIVIAVVIIIGLAAFAYINANAQATKIEVTSSSPLKNGDSVTLVLKDDYRNVYPDQTIDVKVLDDSGWANKYSVTTDQDGQASFTLETYENGNYTMHATFNGTMFLSPAKSVTDLQIDDGYN